VVQSKTFSKLHLLSPVVNTLPVMEKNNTSCINKEQAKKILDENSRAWPFTRIDSDRIRLVEQAYKIVQQSKLQEAPF